MTSDRITVLYRFRRGRLESGGLPYESLLALAEAFPPATHDLVEDRRGAERYGTERTEAGRQIVPASMIARKVPVTPIRAKLRQTEALTELEGHDARQRQGKLF